MNKQELFLWGVQTVVLANNANLIRTDSSGEKAHIYSASAMIGLVNDAIRASKRIPEDMSAERAVDEFCGYILENLRDDETDCPAWFMNSAFSLVDHYNERD